MGAGAWTEAGARKLWMCIEIDVNGREQNHSEVKNNKSREEG